MLEYDTVHKIEAENKNKQKRENQIINVNTIKNGLSS